MMPKDRSREKQVAEDIEKKNNKRFEEMEQTLIQIQQDLATTTSEFLQWRLQPTDWNARNTTIEVSTFLLCEEHDNQQTEQAITTNSRRSNTRTHFFDWKPSLVFLTHCVIKDRACRFLYGGNNIVSKGLVEKLKLKTLRKYPSVRVRGTRVEDEVAEETCRVPVSVGGYKDRVTCYVVNTGEEEQLLFGGPWLYRFQATHDARDNSCMIKWNHNMILLQPQV